MNIKKKVGIIGTGGIAQYLKGRLEKHGIEVCFNFGRGGKNQFSELMANNKPDAVFLTISTLDKGEAARDYILDCVEHDIPIITCEKGSLSYHADMLKPYISLIGFSAAVGGGTLMLPYAAMRPLSYVDDFTIQAVLNGTLNYVFDEFGNGVPLGQACEQALNLGYAEPGSDNPVDLINGELKDVSMKVCVYFNTILGRNVFLNPDKLGILKFLPADVRLLSEEGVDYRMAASFSKQRNSIKHLGKSLEHEIEAWHITAGFRPVSSWMPNGVGNALYITEGDLGSGGQYSLQGPGAGHEPTTTAMLSDFCRLCKL